MLFVAACICKTNKKTFLVANHGPPLKNAMCCSNSSKIQWRLITFTLGLRVTSCLQHQFSQRLLTRVDESQHPLSYGDGYPQTTLKGWLSVQHIRDTSIALVNRCWHAGYYRDQSCSLYLQDNLCLTSIPPSCCVILDLLLHLWSGKGPLKRDEAPGLKL